jgi:hypothetical protein
MTKNRGVILDVTCASWQDEINRYDKLKNLMKLDLILNEQLLDFAVR